MAFERSVPRTRRGRARKAGQSGFTLIELMVVIAISAVLAGIGVPAFFDSIASSRIRSVTGELYAAALTARSEAIKRNVDVNLAAIGGNWNSGWTVAAGGQTFLTYAPNNVQIAVTPSSATSVAFSSNGRISSGSDVVWVISSSRANVLARCVGMSASGRPKQGVGNACT